MSCKISRRSFLKVSGCLMLGSAVSGLLCGAGDPAEGGAAVPTVGGLQVNYVRAFAKDYGNNFRQMEIHLNIENTNSSKSKTPMIFLYTSIRKTSWCIWAICVWASTIVSPG